MYKVKLGFAVTLVEDFRSSSKMFEKVIDLPFVPSVDIAIEMPEGMNAIVGNIKYVLADNSFVCVCNGYQTRQIDDFNQVTARLIEKGWAELDRMGTATVVEG